MRGRGLKAGVALALAAGGLGLAVMGALAAIGTFRVRPRPFPAGTEIAVRGHYDADLTPEGALVPLFLGKRRQVGICFSPPPEVDTSRWSARISLAGRALAGGRPLAPAVRMAATLCFEVPPPDPAPDGALELCVDVRDGRDGRDGEGPRLREVCRRVRFGRAGRGKEWGALQGDVQSLIATGGSTPLPAWLAELDGLARRIEGAGFPLLAVQAKLVGVSFCRRNGTPEALREARRRLAALPRWLELPPASWQAGQAAYEAAALDLADGFRLEAAWRELRRADRFYLRVANSYRFTVAVQQAEILALVGATGEGAGRLRAALAECDRAPCEEYLLPTAHHQLAWMILLDPDASALELEEARGLVQKALASPQAFYDPVERVNWLVNLAYLQVRQGRDPAAELRAAREQLQRPAGGGASFLLGWSDLVEGWAALEAGDAQRALALCGRWTGDSAAPRLAARALSCAASAYRQEGEGERALWSLEQALLLHEVAGPAQLGQRLPLGPGQRADDYYEAVRLAVDLGEPQRAWELLDRLDGLAADEEGERQCRGDSRDPALAQRWAEAARERGLLLSRVLALDLPASGERRRQLEAVRRGLKEQLQELARRSLPCPVGGAAAPGRLAGFRAVPLANEVLLLHRDRRGVVTLDHRTSFDRREIQRIVERVAEELDRRTLPDPEWRRLLAPLSDVLLPRRLDREGEVLRYALHGPLQGVPLAALPVTPAESASPWIRKLGRAGSSSPPLWFSDLATIAVLPAGLHGTSPAPAAPAQLAGSPLFVVDPRGDLPGGGDLAGLYERSFPRATVLRGEEAARDRFRLELRRASLLHLDTHGLYDPAFPELSSLVLADGPVSLSDLADLPTPSGLVNLSGCRTGEWPITADSGQYGLAGLFARRGAAWVVASRADLDDSVARDFNRAFYTEAGTGVGVAESYRRALAAVRKSHPVADWGGLLLLRGAGPRAAGEEP